MNEPQIYSAFVFRNAKTGRIEHDLHMIAANSMDDAAAALFKALDSVERAYISTNAGDPVNVMTFVSSMRNVDMSMTEYWDWVKVHTTPSIEAGEKHPPTFHKVVRKNYCISAAVAT